MAVAHQSSVGIVSPTVDWDVEMWESGGKKIVGGVTVFDNVVGDVLLLALASFVKPVPKCSFRPASPSPQDTVCRLSHIAYLHSDYII